MPIVVSKSHRWRVLAAHGFLIVFLLFTLFPVSRWWISISLRPGNFAMGSLIPEHISFEHWRLALGLSYVDVDGRVITPPFPVMHWLWNSIQGRRRLGGAHGRAVDDVGLRILAPQVPRQGPDAHRESCCSRCSRRCSRWSRSTGSSTWSASTCRG